MHRSKLDIGSADAGAGGMSISSGSGGAGASGMDPRLSFLAEVPHIAQGGRELQYRRRGVPAVL